MITYELRLRPKTIEVNFPFESEDNEVKEKAAQRIKIDADDFEITNVISINDKEDALHGQVD